MTNRLSPDGDSLSLFLEALRARGVRVWVASRRRLRAAPSRLLSKADKAFMRSNNAALVSLVAAEVKQPAAPEPEPRVWTADYTRRITAADVAAFTFPKGLSKQEIYEQTRDLLEGIGQAQRNVHAMRAYLAREDAD